MESDTPALVLMDPLTWKSKTSSEYGCASNFTELKRLPSWILELWTRVASLNLLHFLVDEVTFLILCRDCDCERGSATRILAV